MKKLLLLLIACAFYSAAFAQDKQAIAGVLEKQRTAWNKGDIEGFMQYYIKSDSLMFVGRTGVTYGWQNTFDNYKKGYPDRAAMGTLAFDILKIDLIDDKNAFVLGRWQLQRASDKPGGYFTLWFKKINGQWLVAVDHTS